MSLLWGWISKYVWAAVAIAAAVLLLALGVQTHRVKLAKAETAEVKTAWAADREQATAAMLKLTEEYRAEEQRRLAAQKEIADEADRKITQARADAAISDAAAGRLQQRVAALVAQARAAAANPGTPQASPSASDPIGMLADVLKRSDAIAGQLAEYADQARTAGQACESAYDALTR